MKSNSLSHRDSQRIEKSFFTASSVQRENSNYKQKKLIFVLAFSLALSLIAVFILHNFNIVIFPRVKDLTQSKMIDLLPREESVEPELLHPQGNSKILNNVIYLDVPHMKKSGFSLNFKEELDMRGTKLILLLKEPHPDLRLDVVLRDTRFFSNARNPITMEILHQSKKSDYNKISIPVEDQTDSHISIERINQLRFIFQQQETEFLPIFVKNIYLGNVKNFMKTTEKRIPQKHGRMESRKDEFRN